MALFSQRFISEAVSEMRLKYNLFLDALNKWLVRPSFEGADIGGVPIPEVFTVSNHYSGFPERASTSLGFNDGTFTLTLTATADPVWINGVMYTINTLTKALTAAQELVSGLYWFWLTATASVVSLNASITFPGFDKCLVATVYWNTTINKGIVSDERHWMGRDKWVHEYLHETIGARYSDGMTASFTDTTFVVGAGEFYDEDIEHMWISSLTSAHILYHNGSAAWEWDLLTTPYKVVNPGVDNTLRYNNGIALASVDNNKFAIYWVFATGDVNYPINIFIGPAQYALIVDARSAPPPLLGGLVSAESKLIYKAIYKNVGGTPDFQELIDYRTSSLIPADSYIPTSHSTLTGLANLDHPASAIMNTPAGNISATDVQAAINELDTEKTTLAAALLAVYPVGAIYLSVVSTSPATLFGGTWAVFAAGKALVGLDVGDTDFDTAEETRGAKTHTLQTTEIPAHNHPIQYGATLVAGVNAFGLTATNSGSTTIGNTGGGGAHNNIQPSIVVYMWKRTA